MNVVYIRKVMQSRATEMAINTGYSMLLNVLKPLCCKNLDIVSKAMYGELTQHNDMCDKRALSSRIEIVCWRTMKKADFGDNSKLQTHNLFNEPQLINDSNARKCKTKRKGNCLHTKKVFMEPKRLE